MRRLLNLWAWSSLDPKEVGGLLNQLLEVNKTVSVGAQIIYPSRTEEILKAKPDASLDDLVS